MRGHIFKVLIIHPYRNKSSTEFGIMSFGLISTANYLTSIGFDVKGINFPLEYSFGFTEDKFVQLIKNFNPDIALVSLHWYEFFLGAIEISEIIKSNINGAKIVLAGLTAKLLSNYLLDNFKNIDYIINSTYELQNLLIYLGYDLDFKKAKKNNYTNISWLNHSTEYYKLNIFGYKYSNINSFWIPVGSGCLYNCSYCGGSRNVHTKVFGNNGFSQRTMDEICSDVKILKKYNIDEICFSHDIEFLKNMITLIDFLKSINIEYYYETFQLPSDGLINKLNDKFRIGITAISGNESLRYQEGKIYSNKKLLNTLQLLASKNINVDLFFTLNVIGDNYNKFEETIELARTIRKYNNVSLYCMPYFQSEIASNRWVESGMTIEKTVNILKGYLLSQDKDQYFENKYQDINIKKKLWKKYID